MTNMKKNMKIDKIRGMTISTKYDDNTVNKTKLTT